MIMCTDKLIHLLTSLKNILAFEVTDLIKYSDVNICDHTYEHFRMSAKLGLNAGSNTFSLVVSVTFISSIDRKLLLLL